MTIAVLRRLSQSACPKLSENPPTRETYESRRIFRQLPGIVKYHDNEQGDAHRPDTAGQRNSRKAADACFNRHPSNATDLSLTSIVREGNTGEPAKLPGNQASKSSDASSRHSRSPKAWASEATFVSGSTCCASAIEDSGPRGTIALKLCNLCDESPLGIRLHPLSR